MDYIFVSEFNAASNTEPHEHEIKFYKDYNSPVEVSDRFITDNKNFYVVFAGTPYITFYSDKSTEQEAELTRIKNYIDSLTTAYIDYDELDVGLRVYYYADELSTNTWRDYDDQWLTGMMPCTIMQGNRNVAMARFGSPEVANYTAKHCVLTNTSIELNSETTKLVFVEGDDYIVNGTDRYNNHCELITGNVSISTTDTAYIMIIEDAV